MRKPDFRLWESVSSPSVLDSTLPETAFDNDVRAFLSEWFSPSVSVSVQSSGSTGTPKHFFVEKSRMRASARMTCSFLGITERDIALLCMPLQFIGAKMVVVRSAVTGMRLLAATPSSHPLKGLNCQPTFIAMTPAQVYTSLETEEEEMRLRNARHIIIGGSSVDAALQSRLMDFPNAVWSTYGMTETLSHIALRRLNGPEASQWYTPLPGVRVRLTERETLAIHANGITTEELQTNDLAQIDGQGRFRIRGRTDNTINSGGIKMQIEELEQQLADAMPCPFMITAAPDKHYGEVVVMLVEGPQVPANAELICRRLLHRYCVPKRFIAIHALPKTGSGKPDRASARRLAAQPIG